MQNIIQGSWAWKPRKEAYITALEKTQELGGYHTAFNLTFNSAWKAEHKMKPMRLHQDSLPPPLNSWRQMLKHRYSAEFKKATNKEFEALLAKGTFKYIKASEIDSKAQVIPLMWIFTYKFDQDGSLLKYKA